VLIGVAFSMENGPFTIAATDGIDADEQGMAGGLLYTSWQFGSALGLAVVTAIKVGASDGAQASMDGFRAALIVPVIAAAFNAVVVAWGLRACRDCPDLETPAGTMLTGTAR
jgi:hypothetical protein